MKALSDCGVLDGALCDDGFCPDEPLDRKTPAVWAMRMIDRSDLETRGTRLDDIDHYRFHAPLNDGRPSIQNCLWLGISRTLPQSSNTNPFHYTRNPLQDVLGHLLRPLRYR